MKLRKIYQTISITSPIAGLYFFLYAPGGLGNVVTAFIAAGISISALILLITTHICSRYTWFHKKWIKFPLYAITGALVIYWLLLIIHLLKMIFVY